MVVGSYHLRSLIRVLHAFVVVVGGKKEREGGGGRRVKAHKSKAAREACFRHFRMEEKKILLLKIVADLSRVRILDW